LQRKKKIENTALENPEYILRSREMKWGYKGEEKRKESGESNV
jgi:hypothetical protein